MFTPLYTRPVVLGMLKEWFEHSLARAGLSERKLLGHFDRIVSNQIKRILTRDALPEVMREGRRTPFGTMGLMGHAATYSLNLVLLRTVLGRNGYEFDETEIGEQEDGARSWDRLTHLWRSWFSLDSLSALAAVWTAKRNDRRISLKPRTQFGGPGSGDRLESVRRVSLALADDIGAGLAGLAVFGRAEREKESAEEIGKRLFAEGIDLRVELFLRQLQSPMQRFMNFEERTEILQAAWRVSDESGGSERQVMDLLTVAGEVSPIGLRLRGLEETVIRNDREGSRSPEAALVLFGAVKKAGVERWYSAFDWDYADYLLARVLGRELREWKGGGLVELVRVARMHRDSVHVEEFTAKFFERSPGEILVLRELGPEGVIEFVQFAAEMGQVRWFEEALGEIAGWLERDWQRYEEGLRMVVAVILSVRRIAYEYGLEQSFDIHLESLVRRIRESDNVRSDRLTVAELMLGVGVLGESSSDEDLVGVMVRQWGPRVLYELSPDISGKLLAGGVGRWSSVTSGVLEKEWERWVERGPGALQEKVWMTLEMAQARDRFDVFERRFRVGQIDCEEKGRRWKIVLMEPRGTIVLHVPTVTVKVVNAFRWMLQRLGRTELVAELDRGLGWRAEREGLASERDTWGQFWSRLAARWRG